MRISQGITFANEPFEERASRLRAHGISGFRNGVSVCTTAVHRRDVTKREEFFELFSSVIGCRTIELPSVFTCRMIERACDLQSPSILLCPYGTDAYQAFILMLYTFDR